jgi:hypothetical protein
MFGRSGHILGQKFVPHQKFTKFLPFYNDIIILENMEISGKKLN